MTLSPGEALWFTQEGVDLADPRITPTRRPSGDGHVIEFHVHGAAGPTQVRFETAAERVNGGPPWVITDGPAHLQGCRYADVGEAVRAALTGQPTPVA